MKKEKDICKDCAEYGSEFCPECLEEQHKQDKKSEPLPVDKLKK